MSDVKPDFEAFARAIMEPWPYSVPDGFELQELAEEHGLLLRAPGGFDPEKHDDVDGFGIPGEPWLVRNY